MVSELTDFPFDTREKHKPESALDGLAVIEKRRDELAAKVAAYELVVRECDTRMDCGFTCLICEETEQHSQDCPVPAALKALKE